MSLAIIFMLFENDKTRNILLGALSAIWQVIDPNATPATRAAFQLVRANIDPSFDKTLDLEKNVPFGSSSKDELLEAQTLLFSEARRTISLKNPVEKKNIAFQLMGFQIKQSKEPVSAKRAARVVGTLLKRLDLMSAEIESLREEIREVRDQQYAPIQNKIMMRQGRLRGKKIWNASIKEACLEILKEIRENGILPAKDRKSPVDGLKACKAFLDEYIFSNKPDYTPKEFHSYYRKVKSELEHRKKCESMLLTIPDKRLGIV